MASATAAGCPSAAPASPAPCTASPVASATAPPQRGTTWRDDPARGQGGDPKALSVMPSRGQPAPPPACSRSLMSNVPATPVAGSPRHPGRRPHRGRRSAGAGTSATSAGDRQHSAAGKAAASVSDATPQARRGQGGRTGGAPPAPGSGPTARATRTGRGRDEHQRRAPAERRQAGGASQAAGDEAERDRPARVDQRPLARAGPGSVPPLSSASPAVASSPPAAPCATRGADEPAGAGAERGEHERRAVEQERDPHRAAGSEPATSRRTAPRAPERDPIAGEHPAGAPGRARGRPASPRREAEGREVLGGQEAPRPAAQQPAAHPRASAAWVTPAPLSRGSASASAPARRGGGPAEDLGVQRQREMARSSRAAASSSAQPHGEDRPPDRPAARSTARRRASSARAARGAPPPSTCGPVVAHQARVVREAVLREQPERLGGQLPAGRAVAARAEPPDGLERREPVARGRRAAASRDIRVQAAVGVPVMADLVPGRRDARDRPAGAARAVTPGHVERRRRRRGAPSSVEDPRQAAGDARSARSERLDSRCSQPAPPSGRPGFAVDVDRDRHTGHRPCPGANRTQARRLRRSTHTPTPSQPCASSSVISRRTRRPFAAVGRSSGISTSASGPASRLGSPASAQAISASSAGAPSRSSAKSSAR